jgi:hypothetical protein
MKKKENNSSIQYTKENTLLNMIAIPYIGIYSPNYTFMIPVNVLYSNSINETIFKTFPQNLQKHFLEFQEVEMDYFLITLDGSYLYSKYAQINNQNGYLRLNFVPHPYIFYDVKDINKDHVTNIYSCIYSLPQHLNYLKDSGEFDGLRINHDKIMSNDNKKEIILHKSSDNLPALSPNNCAFLVNINNCFFTFFNLTIVTYHNKVVKFMIAQYNVIMNHDIYLLSPSLNLISSFNYNSENMEINRNFVINLFSSKENIKFMMTTVFYYISRKILNNNEIKDKQQFKEEIKNIFYLCFFKSSTHSSNMNLNNLDDYEDSMVLFDDESMRNISNYFYDELCYFLWCYLGRVNIPGFGENIIFASITNKNYLIEILSKFLRKKIYDIENFFNSYFVFFEENVFNVKEKKVECETIIEEGILNFKQNRGNNILILFIYR